MIVFHVDEPTSLNLKSYLPVTETASQDIVADVKPILLAVTLVGSKQLGGSLITYVAEAVQPEPSVAVTVYVPADNAVVSALFKSKVTEPKPPLTLILAVPSEAPYVVASVVVTVILNPHAGIVKFSVPL